jgi:hypothetical protein
MPQHIETPTAEDETAVEEQRSWVRNHYPPDSREHYGSVDGKLTLLEAILMRNWVASHETWKLQSLGITFGDALAQELGLSWVTIEDEYGRDPALRDGDTTTLLFPLTTISKRVERGEVVDIRDLFEEACRTVRSLRDRQAS